MRHTVGEETSSLVSVLIHKAFIELPLANHALMFPTLRISLTLFESMEVSRRKESVSVPQNRPRRMDETPSNLWGSAKA